MRVYSCSLLCVISLVPTVFSDGNVTYDNCYKTKQLASESPILPYEGYKLHPLWVGPKINHLVFTFKVRSSTSGKEIIYGSRPDWETYKFLEIPKYGILPDMYRVTIVTNTIEPYPGTNYVGPHPQAEQYCYIYVQAVPPAAVITGGNLRSVADHVELLINGEESYDANYKNNSKNGLEYHWTCTQKLKPASFCTADWASNEGKFIIPHKYVELNDQFDVVLEVTSSFGPKTKQTQAIVVSEQSSHLEISCIKNCLPASQSSSYQVDTLIRVKCVRFCDGFSTSDYEWTVKSSSNADLNFDYSKNADMGRTGEKFLINKNALGPGDYVVEVKINESATRQGQAAINIFYEKPLDIKDCQIKPNSGDNIHTDFYLSCTQDPKQLTFYELYVQDNSGNERLIIGGSYPTVFEKVMKLPVSEGKRFVVKVSHETAATFETTVDVSVQSATAGKSTNETINLLNDLYFGSSENTPMSDLLKNKDPMIRNKAMQLTHALVAEITSTNATGEGFEEFFDKFRANVALDVFQTPLTSPEDVITMTDTVTALATHNTSQNANPDTTKLFSTVCKKLADKYTTLIQKEKNIAKIAEKTLKTAITLQKCVDSATHENSEKLESKKPLNVTTEVPQVSGKVETLTENYPDYIYHDGEYYQNVDLMKETTYNVFRSAAAVAKMIALTTLTGENAVRAFGKSGGTVVAKDAGMELAKARIESQGVVLVPSQDFANSSHSFDILLSTWSKDILWWNPKHTRTATDIVSVEVWHSTCKERIRNFTKPANLFFKIKRADNYVLNIFDFRYHIPTNYSVNQEEKGDVVFVCRAILPKGHNFIVTFHDIDFSNSLRVVMIENKFPTIEDFENNTVAETNSSLWSTNFNDFNVFVYIGILPKQEFVDENRNVTRIEFNVSFETTSCIRWSALKTLWLPTCEPGAEGNSSVINCECTHFSLIAGYMQNIRVLRQRVWLPELEMKLYSCYVIFLTVVTTLCIFFFLMLLILTRSQQSPVYFIADNEKDHRYAYLVTVKTGNSFTSGTTSNVVIKLHGDKISSEPHVLNYPDPKLKLMQNFGVDEFVLTTREHLGDLADIEVWLDFIDNSPSWYCNEIVIRDMQLQAEWTFKINRRFSVYDNNTYMKVVPRGVGTTRLQRFLHYLLAIKNHTWYLWRRETNFSYVTRLCVILSNVLLTYATVLVFLGVPSFHLRDGFDNQIYDLEPIHVTVGFASGFLTFLLHFGIASCFRLSRVQFSDHQAKFSFTTRMVCWLVVIVLITISTLFLLVAGFWVPMNRSLLWLTSSFIALIAGVLIYESVFVICQRYFYEIDFYLVESPERKFYRIWRSTEDQRWYLYKLFGGSLLRPYFEHLFHPLSRKAIKKKQLILKTRRYIITELEDLVMFAIYLIILYGVILSEADDLQVKGKNELELVMHGQLSHSLNFDDLEHVEQIYEYLENTLIPSLQPKEWYSNYTTFTSALMVDMVNKYIGVVRMRQQRVRNDSCVIPKKLKFLNLECKAELTSSTEERGIFGFSWQPFDIYMIHDRLFDMWMYYKVNAVHEITSGEIAHYHGGGYVTFLGRNLHNSFINFGNMLEKLWIDKQTRALFIEFLTYNGNANYFSSVKLLVEQSATGYMHALLRVDSVRMIFRGTKMEQFSIIIFNAFFFWVLVLLFKKSVGAISNYHTFYKDFWLLTDFIIIIMSLVCVFIFVLRSQLIRLYLNQIEKSRHNKFLDYFYLFYVDYLLTFVSAMLVSIATIRLWKFLRFGKMFRRLELTLKIALPFLLTTALVFAVVLSAQTLTLTLMIGNEFEIFHSLVGAARLLVTSCFRAVEMRFRTYVHLPWAIAFIIVYAYISEFLLMIFAIIVLKAYVEAQQQMSAEVVAYSIKDFIQEQIRYMPKFLKYKYGRLKGGQIEHLKVIPKGNKFLYYNCCHISTHRMTSMKYITLCMIRNMRRWQKTTCTNRDFELMLEVCIQLNAHVEQTEVDVFYKGRTRTETIKLVDEQKIDKMANIVSIILEDDAFETMTAEYRESSVILNQCVKMIGVNKKTLKRCDQMLHLLLYKMNAVQLDFSKIVN